MNPIKILKVGVGKERIQEGLKVIKVHVQEYYSKAPLYY
jgi:hypothetical protein